MERESRDGYQENKHSYDSKVNTYPLLYSLSALRPC